MPIYYRDHEVVVTNTSIRVGAQVFPLPELAYVWHERGRPTLRTTTRRLARIGLIGALTVPVVAGAAVAANLVAGEGGGLLPRVAMAVAVAALGLVALALLAPVIEFPMMALERSYDRGTTVREIWVRWRDQDLVLLRTADAARFGRIYRAIQRAVELQER